MGCVDAAHADVPSRRRVRAKAVQSVQQAKASAGHSSKVTEGCTDTGLTLGLASLETTQLGQTSCRASSSRGLRAWREAVRVRSPLARTHSSTSSSSTVSPSSNTPTTLTSGSLTSTTAGEARDGPHEQPTQPEPLRLWRSDRMWTQCATTTMSSRNADIRKSAADVGTLAVTRQDSGHLHRVIHSDSAVVLFKQLISV